MKQNDKQIYSLRIDSLRELMSKHGIDAYVVLSDDFHGSEYVGAFFRCREFISGFDGSAGSLVVTEDEACIWTDGRYFLQAETQLSGTGIKLMKINEPEVPKIAEYLNSVLMDGQCLGFDGRTVRGTFMKELKNSFNAAGKDIMFETDLDLVGIIWKDRPKFPAEDIWELGEKYAGKSRIKKLSEVRQVMSSAGVGHHIISSLDDIAWLLNLRGSDIENSPVFMAYLLIEEKKAVLYAEMSAISAALRGSLEDDGVIIRPYRQLYHDLRLLDAGTALMLDTGAVNTALLDALPDGVKIIDVANPSQLMKAVKNPVEIENERAAHIKDGVAVTKIICRLKQLAENELRSLTELDVAADLEDLRRNYKSYIGPSFTPIVASGAHAAIVHYAPAEETNMPIEADNFLLMDTGGHYLEGTTDITRTIAIGRITDEQKRNYTAVLKGNLNLADAYFKYGATGVNLDYLARVPLWKLGLDYNHGTGHGVGYLLNVHEGPNNIRLKAAEGIAAAKFEEGMITSDEPGVYLEGQYGVRLENLLLCRRAEKSENGQFMKFETLTQVPFDRDAVIAEDMSDKELELLNIYHRNVYSQLAEYMTEDERLWLKAATGAIKKRQDSD